MLLFASMNDSVSMTRFQAFLGALRPWEIPANYYHRFPPQLAQVNQGPPIKFEQEAPQLKRKFGKGIACLCLAGTGALIQKWVDAINISFNSPEY